MPFIMNPEGVSRLFSRGMMRDGPFPTHMEPFETPIANVLNPKMRGNPVARVFESDVATFATIDELAEFPYAATSYRLTEHFHYWTKHNRVNAVLQPEFFVEISEELAGEKGIAGGDWVRVWSKRGEVKAKAVVTKRLKPMTCDGKTVHVVGIPLHWGFVGAARKGFGPNSLTPFVGDANVETPEFKAFLVNIEKSTAPSGGRRGMTLAPEPLTAVSNPPVEALESNLLPTDIVRRSATLDLPPPERQLTKVAKLIDVSKCIGCKACQSACIEWNDTHPEIEENVGVLRQPARPDARDVHADAVHRVREPGDRQPRVADPQGRLHALRGSGLPQGLPGARRDRAVFERHRRFHPRELHRLRLLRLGLPVRHPAHLQGHPYRPQVHALLRPGGGGRGAGLRQGLPDPVHHLRPEGGADRPSPRSASPT